MPLSEAERKKCVETLLNADKEKKEAVQLSVAGPADQEGRGHAIMEATLASLEGETNWLTSAERSGRLGTIAGWWIGIAVAAIAILAWRKRRARAA